LSQQKFYVTTPIYYVNSSPHIGNAYTTIAADVIARFKRAMGYEVMFLTGTDEHGHKVQSAAEERGVEPSEYVDQMAEVWRRLWSKLQIRYDDFVRTTQPRHKKAVLRLFERMSASGDIYQGEYEGWYCKHEENFLTDHQVKDGRCPDCGRPVERFKEPSFFFRLSRYEKPLLEYYDSHPEFIRPSFRLNEARSFVSQGLRDLSISRFRLSWGIPIPDGKGCTFYVWIDALTNYLTGIGFGEDDSQFERFWPCDLHVIGKDILKFHCVFWPAMLMSAGIPLPKTIFNHGWLRVAGRKMSKSVGNVVDPFFLVERYGADAVRYFLMRDIQFGLDGNFSEENLISRLNDDLANDLGNLVYRTLSMCAKYFDGQIPPRSGSGGDLLAGECERAFSKYQGLMERLDFRGALEAIWELIGAANTFIDHKRPWQLFGQKREDELCGVLYSVLETERIILLMLLPFIPKAASEMLGYIGVQPESDEILPERVKWGGLSFGRRIGEFGPPFEKIQPAEAFVPEAAVSSADNEKKEDSAMDKPVVTIDEFGRMDLVVGKIVGAEPVSGSRKLFKLDVDIGTEVRTAVAGLRDYYQPDELVGKKVAFIANLAPAKIFGVQSEGMVLAADGEVVSLLVIDKDVPVGTKIR